MQFGLLQGFDDIRAVNAKLDQLSKLQQNTVEIARALFSQVTFPFCVKFLPLHSLEQLRNGTQSMAVVTKTPDGWSAYHITVIVISNG